MSEELDDVVLAALVRRGRQLDAEMKALGEQKKAITDRLDRAVPIGWKLSVDDVVASKRPGNRSFSAALAIAQFTPEEKMECVSTGIDGGKVREIADRRGLTENCMVAPDESKTSVKLG